MSSLVEGVGYTTFSNFDSSSSSTSSTSGVQRRISSIAVPESIKRRSPSKHYVSCMETVTVVPSEGSAALGCIPVLSDSPPVFVMNHAARFVCFQDYETQQARLGSRTETAGRGVWGVLCLGQPSQSTFCLARQPRKGRTSQRS